VDTRVSFEQDQFILDHFEWNARWVATLNDGREVYQDDDRYSTGERDSSWLRLVNFCNENKLWLRNLKVQFRQNELNFPDREAYLLTMGAGGEIYSGITHSFFIIGCPLFNDGQYLNQLWIRTPDMSVVRTNIILVEDLEKDMKDAIIRKV